MSIGPSALSRRRRLGEELRALREARKYTLLQVAGELGWSHTKLSRLENAKVRPDVGDVMDLLEVLGVTGDQERRLIALARQANRRGWWRAYAEMPERQAGVAELEADAIEIWEYALTYVPGLLQTESYARVRCADREGFKDFDIEDAVAARRKRQHILSGDHPVAYTAVLDESLLRRVTAPADVWREQCAHLAETAALPNVALRVLPLAIQLPHHTAPQNSFTIYKLTESNDPDIVHIETESSDLQLGDEEDVDRYRIVQQRITEAAMSPEESLAMIHEEQRAK